MPTVVTNDINLYYESHGQGQPLLLISGVGQGSTFWAPLLPLLTDAFQVITVDNRGVGQSDMPDIPYSVEMMAADTLGLIEALGMSQPPHLVGHSLGAFIAFELARSYPQQVGRLVMASALYPGPQVTMPSAEALDMLTDRSGDPLALIKRGLQIATGPNFAQEQAQLFERLLQINLVHTQPPHIYLRQSAAGSEYVRDDKLAQPERFTTPLCMIYGEYDYVSPIKNGKSVQAVLPQAQLHEVPEAGHLLPVEKPPAFAQIIRQFFMSA